MQSLARRRRAEHSRLPLRAALLAQQLCLAPPTNRAAFFACLCREAAVSGGSGGGASAGAGSSAAALPPSGPEQGFVRYACASYVLTNLETPTGYRFAITSDPSAGDLLPALRHIWSELFVGYALKNPLYVPGTPITASLFASEVDHFVRGLPGFKAPAVPAGAGP